MNSTSDENGWIVKMPYTTNSEFTRGARDYKQVVELLGLAARTYAARVDYAFVQPMMKNKKEYRVVVLGGSAKYVSTINKSVSGIKTQSFSTAPHASLFIFAENAVRALARACPSAITDYILRVDIFQRADGRLVVNEFESLEACVYSTNHARDEAPAQSWMANYLSMKLRECIHHYA